MTVETAELVLYIITGIECVIWMVAFRCLATMGKPRVRRGILKDEADRYDVSHDAPDPAARLADELESIASGSSEIAGDFEQMSARLAQQVAGKFPAAKITAQSPDQLVIEPSISSRWTGFDRIDVAFRPLGETRTEVSYQVWGKPARAPAWAWWLSWIGLAAIIIGFVLFKLYIVPHPNLAIRGQTFQMLQVIHLLWPPFLAVLLGRTRKLAGKAVAGYLDGMVTNLPYQ